MALNTITPLTEYTFKVASIEETNIDAIHKGYAIILDYVAPENLTMANQNYEFIQTEALTELGVAVHPYGAILMNYLAPTQAELGEAKLVLRTEAGDLESNITLAQIDEVGATVRFRQIS